MEGKKEIIKEKHIKGTTRNNEKRIDRIFKKIKEDKTIRNK